MTGVRLGRSQVRVSRLGLGGAQIGNLYTAIDDAQAHATVAEAWDAGIRYFDTAPHYGLGLSERRLGRTLRANDRSEYVISTKVGRLLVPSVAGGDDLAHGFAVPATLRRRWDFSRDGVLRSIEQSLERLDLSTVDVVLIHDPDHHYQWALREAFPALAELRAQGLVGAIGAGMNQWRMLADFVRETDLDVVMLAGRYTLFEQTALEGLLDECQRRTVSVLAAGVYNSGLLARPRAGPGTQYNYLPAPAGVVKRANRIAAICERHGVTLPEAAIQFPLAHPAVAAVVVGAASPAQVRDNAARLGARVPPALWSDLRAAGLLNGAAPVPGTQAAAS